MAYDFPKDLIDLRRRFNSADRQCQEVSAAMPSAVELLEAGVDSTSEVWAPVNEARAGRRQVLEKLNGHKFWDGVDDIGAAKTALREAAKET